MPRILSIVITTVSTSLVVIYPVLVYFSMSRFSVRTLSLVLLAVLLPGQLLRLKGRKREHFKAVLPLMLGIISLLLLAAFVDDHRFILALPAVLNSAFLLGFASSLRGPISIVERFARMQVGDLTPAEVSYCRQVTIIWCIFFAANALLTLALALFAPIEWWTIYAGGLSYVAMGLIFSFEYIVRKTRFRRFGKGWHDRAFARFFPPR